MSHITMTPEQAAAAQKRALEGWRKQGTVRTHRLSNEEEVLGFGHSQVGKSPREIQPQRSKHGAVKIASDDGKFDSKLEARCWQSLKFKQLAGEIKGLRRQVRFSLFAPGGEHLGTYKADFVWLEPITGDVAWKRVVADAKSKYTRKLPWWERTKTLMMACHGITVLEMP